jgi:hypothetical protein
MVLGLDCTQSSSTVVITNGTSSWSAPTAALLISLALSPPDVQLGLVPSEELP